MRKALLISVWIILGVSTFGLMGFAENKRLSEKCKNLNISIISNDNCYFITPSDISALIRSKFGEIRGTPMRAINFRHLESFLNSNPFILKTKIFATLDGKVNIKLTEKNPIARICPAKGYGYYIDSCGFIMPLTMACTSKVLVVNGYIGIKPVNGSGRIIHEYICDKDTGSELPGIYRMATFINKSPFWKAQITQIYIDSAKNYNLIPRMGNQKIIFGDTSDMEQKFNRLWVFYKYGLNTIEDIDKYSSINLKFKHQIICTIK